MYNDSRHQIAKIKSCLYEYDYLLNNLDQIFIDVTGSHSVACVDQIICQYDGHKHEKFLGLIASAISYTYDDDTINRGWYPKYADIKYDMKMHKFLLAIDWKLQYDAICRATCINYIVHYYSFKNEYWCGSPLAYDIIWRLFTKINIPYYTKLFIQPSNYTDLSYTKRHGITYNN
jgi:hypothetical protein